MRECRREQGFSILDAILLAAFLAVVMAVLSSRLTDSGKSARDFAALKKRDLLLAKISQLANSTSALEKSALDPRFLQQNRILHNCLTGAEYLGCTASSATGPQVHPFALIGPSGGVMASGVGNHAFYTLNGDPCIAGAPGCVFKAEVYFSPQCFNQMPACTKAEGMKVQVQVKQVTASLGAEKGTQAVLAPRTETTQIGFSQNQIPPQVFPPGGLSPTLPGTENRVRICIQFTDNDLENGKGYDCSANLGHQGIMKCSACGGGWTDWASDSNKYGPGCVRIYVDRC